MTTTKKYTPQDYRSELSVRWCPGCGDYALLNSLQRAMAELELNPDQTAVVSGIGCSSRLPYYMKTYGFHTIHGRGLVIATGIKVANPSLSVWHVTGDGDCLAIGGNHFIHAVRRNVNINVVLLNNRIYGLTKGQYSPTSEKGFVSASSPMGTVEEPFEPADLSFGARASFFARTIDVDVPNSVDVLVEAEKHKGLSIVEVLQNCVIFNDGIYSHISDREWRVERTILLKHGEKMIFGKDNNKGLVQSGFSLKAVAIGEDGYTIEDVLVHDAKTADDNLHRMLGRMRMEDGMPVALGVIRNVEKESYDEAVSKQLVEAKKTSNIKSLKDYLMSKDIWEVK